MTGLLSMHSDERPVRGTGKSNCRCGSAGRPTNRVPVYFFYKEDCLPGGAPLWFDKLHRLIVADKFSAAGFFYHNNISAYPAPLYFTGLLDVYHPIASRSFFVSFMLLIPLEQYWINYRFRLFSKCVLKSDTQTRIY